MMAVGFCRLFSWFTRAAGRAASAVGAGGAATACTAAATRAAAVRREPADRRGLVWRGAASGAARLAAVAAVALLATWMREVAMVAILHRQR